MAIEDLAAYRLLIADVYELAGESRRTSEGLAREVGQSAARWHVLSVVSDGPRTVAGAARRLGLARQSVQRVVDELAAAGLVELHANPDHVRSPLVALTSAGTDTLAGLVQRSDADRAALLARAGVGGAELAAARGVLRRLLAALHEPADEWDAPVRGRGGATSQQPDVARHDQGADDAPFHR